MTNYQKNIQFLKKANALTVHVITKNIADHYEITQGQAYEEVVARGAEHLLDYMTGNERILVMDMMKAQGYF
tara:strand:- start:41 stop:256 length:216 start_codon:yes stop_codon:yes gene_type:complete